MYNIFIYKHRVYRNIAEVKNNKHHILPDVMYHTLSTSWNPQEETLLDTGECAADTIKQLLKYYVNHWCRTATTACGFYGICMKKVLWDLQVNPIIIIFFHYNIFQHKIILLP